MFNKKFLTGPVIACSLLICVLFGVIVYLALSLKNLSAQEPEDGLAPVRPDVLTVSESEESPLADYDSEYVLESDSEAQTDADSDTDSAAVRPAPAAPVKAVYQTANRMGTPSHVSPLLDLCKSTELNAIVFDVKNDSGEITFFDGFAQETDYGVRVGYISDIKALLDELREAGVYPIARVVAFKDNSLCEKRPDLYIKDAAGGIYRDNAKNAWLNPYNKDAWEYLTDIAVSSIELGFAEVQFDYIRFDTSSRLNACDFGDTDGLSRTEIIAGFAAYAASKIREAGGFVSADVYGTVISSKVDANIVGQDFALLAQELDYICPMIYPSHYANGSFGIDYPDTEPYAVISAALSKAAEVLGEFDKKAVVRPYLQAFTASYLSNYIEYTPDIIREQIRAVYDCGYTEWILWNASGNYDGGVFLPE